MINLTTINMGIAVIGAGFAGLQAAVDAHKAGLSYSIIEANDRVGGKILTTQLVFIGGIVELGPTWIDNETQPRMTDLTKRYNLKVIERYIEGLGIFYSANGTATTTEQGQTPEVGCEFLIPQRQGTLTMGLGTD
jgi:monoamine oxidase